MKHIILEIENKSKLNVKLAVSEKEKEYGLMNVNELPNNQGMLFYFNDLQKRSFWMKNTYIPLDVIFILNNTIVDIKKNNKPLNLDKIISTRKCNLVLEVNGNYTKFYNIRVGDTIKYFN